jgi:hypothetical protein
VSFHGILRDAATGEFVATAMEWEADKGVGPWVRHGRPVYLDREGVAEFYSKPQPEPRGAAPQDGPWRPVYGDLQGGG